MTTSNKNFRVKNGLEVLGVSATVDGNEVLTTASTLDALANVDTTGVVDGNTIVFNEATSTFIAGAISGGAAFEVSDTAPLNPDHGDVWYNSDNGGLFIFIEDIDSSQWVQIGLIGPQGLQGETGEPGILIQGTEPEDTDVLWFDTSVDGEGVPLGGDAGQVLAKIDSTDFNTEWVTTLSQSDIDLALEDYYTGAQIDTALGDYYTAAEIDASFQDYYASASAQIETSLQDYYTISQTDSVISSAISDVVDTAPEVLDTLNELSAALNDDPNFATTVANALAALVPSGTIMQTARVSAPTGYLMCDGSAISRTTYSALFDAIGTVYGSGDGSTTFNVPDLRGKVPVGKNSGTFGTLGATGGAETHTLTESEMPSHTHIQDSHNHTQNSHNHTQNSHNHTQNAHTHSERVAQNAPGILSAPGSTYGVAVDAAGTTGSTTATNQATTATNNATTATNNATTATNQNTGGGQAHNNLQPYVVVNHMIKI